MSLDDLREVKHGRTPRTCVACKAFKAECQVPIGEGSTAMCWLCAHHVVDHDTPVHEASTAECECSPSAIYPAHVYHDINLEIERGKEAARRRFEGVEIYRVPPEDVAAREAGYRSCANWKELYKEH